MSRKMVLSLILLSTLCLPVTPRVFGFDDNNLVYVIQTANLGHIAEAGHTITFPFDARFTGISLQELARRENWNLEVGGNQIQNEPGRVRLDIAPPSPRFIRFIIGDGVDLTGGNVRLIFRGTPNIILAGVNQFSVINVRFANDVPPDDDLQKLKNWLIRIVHLESGAVEQLLPTSVTVFTPPNLKSEPSLGVNRTLDPSTHRITVRFQLPNFPEFTIGEPQKKRSGKAFTKAKGKEDADIYFSGTAVGARGSKPLYSFESKLGYLFNLKRKGALGPTAEVSAASESNIDPDSIKASLTYEKVFVFGPARGLILRSDALGLEFDTENRTRNLMTELNGTLVLPPRRFGENAFAAVDFMAGFEGGHNYRHKLNEDGLGNLWRWKFGVNVYFVALNPPVFKRIDFSTGYKVRLLRSAEPFTETINDEEVTTLRKKPRHHVASDLDFMFSDAFGITLKYRYGSLPPAFKFVDHSGSVGLTFKLKQANK